MKKLIILLLSASFALLTSVAFAHGPKGEKVGTVEIIHKPLEQAMIIRVSINALAAHLEHGDCVFDQEPEFEAKPDLEDAPKCEDEFPPE